MTDKLFLLLAHIRIRGIKGDEARAAENKATLSARLQAYELILSKQKYLAGDVRLAPQLILLDR